jgi:hypothetical protein
MNNYEFLKANPIIVDGMFSDLAIANTYQMIKTLKYNANHKSVLSQKVYESAFVHYFDDSFQKTSLYRRVFEYLTTGLNFKVKLDNAYVHSYGIDHKTKPHIDNSTPTVIYYANPKWEVEWGAYTSLIVDNDIFKAISPKAGRLLIFDGNTLHMGNPPNLSAPDRRWAIVFKFRFIDDNGNEMHQIPFVGQ